MKKAIAALLSLCIFGGNVPSFGDPHTSADASDKNALYAHAMSQYATTETTSSLCDSEKSLEKLTVEAVAAQNTAVRAKAQETAAYAFDFSQQVGGIIEQADYGTSAQTTTTQTTTVQLIQTTTTVEPPYVHFKSIDTDEVYVGNTLEISCTSNYSTSFSSSDNDIAKIDSYAYHMVKVSILKPGKVTIRATIKGFTGNFSYNGYDLIALDIPEPSISLNVDDTKVAVGQTYSIPYTVSKYKGDLVWKSSDESVISVDDFGNVNFLKAGNATISVAPEGFEEYSSEVEFNVIDPYFNFSRTSATVGAYENYTIPVESFGVESVEWATSDPLVSVSDGNLSVFLESGNVTIVAKAKLSNGEMVARTFKLTIGSATPEVSYGDANCDGKVDISDAVMILQAVANPDKYGVNGTSPDHITEEGLINSDCVGGDGITPIDALEVQRYCAGLISSLGG